MKRIVDPSLPVHTDFHTLRKLSRSHLENQTRSRKIRLIATFRNARLPTTLTCWKLRRSSRNWYSSHFCWEIRKMCVFLLLFLQNTETYHSTSSCSHHLCTVNSAHCSPVPMAIFSSSKSLQKVFKWHTHRPKRAPCYSSLHWFVNRRCSHHWYWCRFSAAHCQQSRVLAFTYKAFALSKQVSRYDLLSMFNHWYCI